MRWFIAAFAAVFLLPIYVAVEALRGAHRTSLFEIKGMTISKAHDPVIYRIYYVFFLLIIPMCAALSLCLAYVAYIDPWGN
jgi:hypothetical protein